MGIVCHALLSSRLSSSRATSVLRQPLEETFAPPWVLTCAMGVEMGDLGFSFENVEKPWNRYRLRGK